MGHVLSREGIHPNPGKAKAIRELQEHENSIVRGSCPPVSGFLPAFRDHQPGCPSWGTVPSQVDSGGDRPVANTSNKLTPTETRRSGSLAWAFPKRKPSKSSGPELLISGGTPVIQAPKHVRQQCLLLALSTWEAAGRLTLTRRQHRARVDAVMLSGCVQDVSRGGPPESSVLNGYCGLVPV
ncbi:hypothetical protein AAG570_007871 [Ranatra chinensis]|uniref:Uncharacterized protein n=1 Tax=Ranatra chinensis TaxID=642074 RepID=A0ABD0XV30_9HEMI